MTGKLTANDLKDINFFLQEYCRVINTPEKNKELALKLRNTISEILSEINISIGLSPEEIGEYWENHPEHLNRLITELGEYKKVVDAASGVAYKVPTKDIITKGLKQQELDKYPVWEEE